MDFLEEGDVSAETLATLIGDEFGEAEVDGKQVVIDHDGLSLKVIHSEDMCSVGLSVKWDEGEDTSTVRATRELNEWNRFHAFAFAYIWDGAIHAEHQISCRGGVRAETLRDTIGRFLEAAEELDETISESDAFSGEDEDDDELEAAEKSNKDDEERTVIDVEAIRDMLSSEYDDNEVDDDGDLVVHLNGNHFYIMLDDERKVIRFNTRWSKGDSISDNRAARVMNNWNEKKIFTTAYRWQNKFMLDYHMTYKGGINSTNLNEAFEWFCVGAKQFADMLIDEDAV